MARRVLKFTGDELAEIASLYRSGLGIHSIGERFGCSGGAIHRRLKKMGVQTRPHGYQRCGDSHWEWDGGRYQREDGYWARYAPDHPRANPTYVLEHILIAEEAMGKCLPASADVHHVDGDKSNNDPSNLVVCEDHAYHALLHRRQRALDACGDASARRCGFCGQYGDQDDIYVSPKRNQSRHRSCMRKYHRKYMRKRRAAKRAERCG